MSLSALRIMIFFLVVGCFQANGFSAEPKDTVVMFDVGRVLSGDLLGAVRKDLSKRFEVDEKQLNDSQDKYRDDADMGLITDQEFWQKVMKDHGKKLEKWSNQDFIRYLEKFVTCYDGVLEVAMNLKEAGYRLAILSNDSFEMAKARIHKCGFKKAFDEKNILISADIAKDKKNPKEYIKPQQGIFQYAVEKLHVKSGDVFFIDDKDYNIAGAESVGIHGILFKSSDNANTDETVKKNEKQKLIELLKAKGIQ